MSWATKAVLIVAALAVSAWLIAGPPIPPFSTFTEISFASAYAAEPADAPDKITSRTASRYYRELGMLVHTRPWHEEHLLYYKSGNRETVPIASGVEFNSGPMAMTLAFLLALWTGVVLACRRKSPRSGPAKSAAQPRRTLVSPFAA
jgi:hypothetical protein